MAGFGSVKKHKKPEDNYVPKHKEDPTPTVLFNWTLLTGNDGQGRTLTGNGSKDLHGFFVFKQIKSIDFEQKFAILNDNTKVKLED